jgi:transcriptional regulator with XRE-family HTH domain
MTKKNLLLLQLGKKIRQIREDKGLSQEDLADLAELDRTYIGGVERGERNVTILSLQKICNALKINIKDLFS